MKNFVLSASFALALTACSDDEFNVAEAQPVLPNAAIAGLWVSDVMYDTANTSDRYNIPSDELMYFSFANAEDNPIDTSIYAASETDNCYHLDSGPLDYVGNYRYRDEYNDVLKLKVSDSLLTMYVTIDGYNLAVNFNKVTGIDETDLNVCSTRVSSQFNDDPSGGIVSFVRSEIE